MKKLLKVLALSLTVGAFAQEGEKKLSINGSVDAYYQTTLTAPDDLNQSFGSSFATENGFALGMANLIASYDGEKTGVVADLTFGTRGLEAAGGSAPINQLYVYYNLNEKTTLTFGRFNTYLGYEVISPTGNFNYSTSFLFSSGPFSNVGLKADFTLSDDLSLMVAAMNATDVNNNLTGDYSLGAQLGYKGQYLNLYYDNDAVLGFEVDYTGGFDLTEEFYLGLNAAYQTMNDAGFYGAAIYPQYTVNEKFSIGLREEYFANHAKDVDDLPSVFASTLTANYTIEDLTIKPEIRLDSWSNDEPFVDADGAATPTLSTFSLAAVYSF